MRKSTKKDFVNKMLDLVFSSVKHTDQVEREVQTDNYRNNHVALCSVTILIMGNTYPSY